MLRCTSFGSAANGEIWPLTSPNGNPSTGIAIAGEGAILFSDINTFLNQLDR